VLSVTTFWTFCASSRYLWSAAMESRLVAGPVPRVYRCYRSSPGSRTRIRRRCVEFLCNLSSASTDSQSPGATFSTVVYTIGCFNSAGDRRQRLACPAGRASVDLHSGLACEYPGGFKFSGNVIPRLEVHLIRCLTTERRVRKSCVVRVHVENDQLLKRADGVERVQIQPLMLQRTSP
jgi:hypothetical protein